MSEYYAVEEKLFTGEDISAIYGPGKNPITEETEIRRLWISSNKDRKEMAEIMLKSFQDKEQGS